jgi:hypothetical protein
MTVAGFTPVREVEIKGETYYIPQRELKDYNMRVVRSGNTIEVYEYQNKVFYNYQGYERERKREKPMEWSGKSEISLTRSRRQIRRIIWANIGKYSKFLTLTYAENMQDLQKFYYDWKMFIKSMKRKGYTLKYLYVLEYQERGAIHAHVVIFNEEYIPIGAIEKSWGKGFVKINSIKDIKNLGAYVCKYLTKESLSEYNSKSYHTSRGLNRPIERRITLHDTEDIKRELFSKARVVYESDYHITVDDIVTNTVNYSQLQMTKED